MKAIKETTLKSTENRDKTLNKLYLAFDPAISCLILHTHLHKIHVYVKVKEYSLKQSKRKY